MKKCIAFSLLIFFTSLLSYANDTFSLSITPHTGLTIGQLDEILYDSDGTMCSLIEWEQKPLLNLGLSTDLQINRFIISSGFEYGIQLGNPKMHDSDWNNGQKYSYTTHPLKSSQEINTELSLTFQLYSDYMISILPEIQLQYMYDSFKADKAAGIRYENEIRVYGIDYSRHTFSVFTGLGVGFNIKKILTFNTIFMIAPYTYQYSYDYHHGVKHPFTSEAIQESNFSKFKLNNEVIFKINEKLNLNFYSSLLFGNLNQGLFYTDYFTEKITFCSDQKSGSNIKSAKFGIAKKIKLF